MMSSRVTVTSIVVLLCFLAISEGMSLRSLGAELHCRCIQTESKRIGRFIEKVELIPANSHCENTEIIATLKNTGQEVCLDPEAAWVKKVIEKILAKPAFSPIKGVTGVCRSLAALGEGGVHPG